MPVTVDLDELEEIMTRLYEDSEEHFRGTTTRIAYDGATEAIRRLIHELMLYRALNEVD